MHTKITCAGGSRFLLAVCLSTLSLGVAVFGAGCEASVGGPPGGSGGHVETNGNGTGGTAANVGGSGGSAGGGFTISIGTTVAVGNAAECGNGVIDTGETCDDGIPPAVKIDGGMDDGCNALCQIEANWIVPTAGETLHVPRDVWKRRADVQQAVRRRKHRQRRRLLGDLQH